MGQLIDGKWETRNFSPRIVAGRFQRRDTLFRRWIAADPEAEFPAAPGRYHLYVSLACPWAHRTLIFRSLKRLEAAISVSIVEPFMGDQGWVFGDAPGATLDGVNGHKALYEVYRQAKPDYTGRVTVPVLWDKQTGQIVNNESAEIIRMLNSAFDAFGDAAIDFYPAALRPEIDRVNALVYDAINNGVYKAGFATTQEAYEEAFDSLFAALDQLEARLSGQRYLVGDRLTEADWRLFTTLVRFDAVYFSHFKCNRRRIVDYPALSGYLRELYQVPGVAATVDLDHIKQHYYRSHTGINPNGIVPKGPQLDLDRPHERDRLPAVPLRKAG